MTVEEQNNLSVLLNSNVGEDVQNDINRQIVNTQIASKNNAGAGSDIAQGVVEGVGAIGTGVGYGLGYATKGYGELFGSDTLKDIGDETIRKSTQAYEYLEDTLGKNKYSPYTGERYQSNKNLVASFLAPIPGEMAVQGLVTPLVKTAAKATLRGIGGKTAAFYAGKPLTALDELLNVGGKEITGEVAEGVGATIGKGAKALGSEAVEQLPYGVGFTFPQTGLPEGKQEDPSSVLLRVGMNSGFGVVATKGMQGVTKAIKGEDLASVKNLNEYKNKYDNEGGFITSPDNLETLLKSDTKLESYPIPDNIKNVIRDGDGNINLSAIRKSKKIGEGIYKDENGDGFVKSKRLGTFEIKHNEGMVEIKSKGGTLTKRTILSVDGSGSLMIVPKKSSMDIALENIKTHNTRSYTHEDLHFFDESGELSKNFEKSFLAQDVKSRMNPKVIDDIKFDIESKTPKLDGKPNSILNKATGLFKSVRSIAHDVVIKGITENVPESFKSFNSKINNIIKHQSKTTSESLNYLNNSDIKAILNDIKASSQVNRATGDKSVMETIDDDVIDVFFNKRTAKNGETSYELKSDVLDSIARAKAIASLLKHKDLTTTDLMSISEFNRRNNLVDEKGMPIEDTFHVQPSKVAGILKDLMGLRSDNSIAIEQFNKLADAVVDRAMGGKSFNIVKSSSLKTDGGKNVKLSTILEDTGDKSINRAYVFEESGTGEWNKFVEMSNSSDIAYSNTINIPDKIPHEFRTVEGLKKAYSENGGMLSGIIANTAMPLQNSPTMMGFIKKLSNTVFAKNVTDEGAAYAEMLFGESNPGNILNKVENLLNSGNPKVSDVQQIMALIGHEPREYQILQQDVREVLADVRKEILHGKKLYESGDTEYMTFDIDFTDLTRPMYVGTYNPNNSGIYMQLFRPAEFDGVSGTLRNATLDDLTKLTAEELADAKAIMTSTIGADIPHIEATIENQLATMLKESPDFDKASFNKLVESVHTQLSMEGHLDKGKSFLGVSGFTKQYLYNNHNEMFSKSGLDNTVNVFGTIDAKSSNFNNTMALLGYLSEATGLGFKEFGADIRNEIVDNVAQKMGFLGNLDEFFTKDIVKPLFNGWFYGGHLDNLTGVDETFTKVLTQQIIKTYGNKDNFFRTSINKRLEVAIDNFAKNLHNYDLDITGSKELLGIINGLKIKPGVKSTMSVEAIEKGMERFRKGIKDDIKRLNDKLSSEEAGTINVKSVKEDISAKKDLADTFDAELNTILTLSKIDQKLSTTKTQAKIYNELSETEIEFMHNQINSSLLKSISDDMESILDRKGMEGIKEMRRIVEHTNKAFQLAFYSEAFKGRYGPTTNVRDLLATVMKESNKKIDGRNVTGDKAISLSKAAVSQIENRLRRKGEFGIHDVVQEIANVGQINESIMNWTALADIIPKIRNSSGELVPTFKIGSHAFNYKTDLGSFDLKGPTLFNLMSPIYVISHDVNVMQPSFRPGQVYRYDAVYGGRDILKTGAEANKFVGSNMLTNSNPLAAIEEALFNYKTIFRDGSINESALNEIAKQNILNNGRIVSDDAIKEIMKEYTNLLVKEDVKYDLLNDIRTIAEDSRNRKKAIEKRVENGEDIYVNNFQLDNGLLLDKTAYKLDMKHIDRSGTYPKYNLDNENFIGSKIDVRAIDKVEAAKDVNSDMVLWGQGIAPEDGTASNIVVTKIDGLKDSEGNAILGNMSYTPRELIKASSPSAVQVNGTDFIMRVSSKLTPEQAVPVIFHEASHIAEQLMKSVDSRAYDKSLNNNLSSVINKIKSNLYRKNKPDVSEAEFFTDFLGTLMQNEIVAKNAGIFKAIYGKPSQFIHEFEFTANGATQRISTLTDLINTFDKGTAERGLLEGYRQNYVSTINQQGIKELLFFDKTRNGTVLYNDVQGKFYHSIGQATEKFQGEAIEFVRTMKESEFLEMFSLDRTKTSVDMALGRSKAFAEEVETAMIGAGIKVKKEIDSIDLVGNIADKETFMTQTVMNGYHYVNSVFSKRMPKNFEEAKRIVTDKKQIVFKRIVKDTRTVGKKEAIAIEQALQQFSEGAYKGGTVDLNVIAKDFAKGNQMISHNKLKADIEEYTAYNRFIKNSSAGEYEKVMAGNNLFKMTKAYNMIRSKIMGNEDILFGINPRSMLNTYNQSLMIVDEASAHAVGTVKAYTNDGTLIEKFVVPSDRVEVMAGKRQAQMINPTLADIQKGKIATLKMDGKIYHNGKEYDANYDMLQFNYLNLRDTNDFFSMRMSDVLFGNYYASVKKTQGLIIHDDMFHELRSGGSLVSQDKFKTFPANIQKMYEPLSNNFTKERYGDWYINKRFAHQINGTEGVDVRKLANKYLHKEFAPFVVSTFKLGTAISNKAKSWIIKGRIKSYLNSYVASHTIGIINSSSLAAYVAHGKSSREALSVARKSAQRLHEIQVEKSFKHGKSLTKLEAEEANLINSIQDNDLTYFMQNGGLQTIRSIDEDMNANRTALANMFSHAEGKPGKAESAISTTLDTIALSNDTTFGRKLTELFDRTEVHPKAQFFMSEVYVLRKQGHNIADARSIAMSRTLTAYPTYNNMNQAMAILDDVFPFTKYYSNIPRMAGYAFANNTVKFAGVLTMLHAGSLASWNMAEGNSRNQKDWKYAYIPGVDGKIWTEAFDPYTFSFSSYFNDPFLIDAFKHIANDPSKMLKIYSDVE